MKSYTYNKEFYRIRKTGEDIGYVGNDIFGPFEFLSEENARRHIEDMKLKDVVIDKVKITTTEDIDEMMVKSYQDIQVL